MKRLAQRIKRNAKKRKLRKKRWIAREIARVAAETDKAFADP